MSHVKHFQSPTRINNQCFLPPAWGSLCTVFVSAVAEGARAPLRLCSGRSPLALVQLDACVGNLYQWVAVTYRNWGRKSNITAYGPSTPINYSSRCMHLSTWLTFNMYIFTLCKFLISLSCLDCIHHYIWHSCNYYVTDKIPLRNYAF